MYLYLCHETTKFLKPTEVLQTPIDTIILDLGGVVLNIDYQRTQQAFQQLGFADFSGLYTQFQQTELFVKLEKGQVSPPAFLAALRQYSTRHLTDQQLVNAWNAMLLDLPPENLTAVKRLKEQYHIYLLSNTNAIHYQCFFDKVEALLGQRSLGPYFHETYFSHLVGARKPDQQIFEHIQRLHRLSPASTLFIDDSPQHIAAAKTLGYQVHHKEQQAPLPYTLAELDLPV